MPHLLTTLSLLVILVGSSIDVTANKNQPGGRSAALGTASVALIDLWGAFNNQASLAYVEQPEFGYYYENRFMIKEMSYKATALTYPMKFAVLTISADYYGFSAYNESKIALACSKVISRHISLGVQLDYLMFRQEKEYGNKNILTMEVGLLAKLNDRITFGSHIYNPVNARLTKNEEITNVYEVVPVTFRAGVSYKVTDELLIITEIQKNQHLDPSLKAGVEYIINKKFALRAGIIPTTSTFSFGIGVPIGNLKIDISASHHQVLGFTPQASTSYKF